MSLITSAKRNRSDNFEVDDIELLVNLISEHSDIDSSKLDARKQAWESIASKFNANCTGVKRDIGSLKMKVKNMKAQAAKKPKTETLAEESGASEVHIMSTNSKLDDDNEDDYNETDANQSHSESATNKARKRCKKFTKNECDLLVNLYEKHCQGLDSSCSASSIKRRSEAWNNLTDDFNKHQTSGIKRDESELKIKIKNIKAMRVKTESSSDNLAVSNSQSSITCTTPIKIIEDKKQPIHHSTVSAPSRTRQIVSEALLFGEDDDDDVYEEEYIQPMPMQKEDDKELERVRRENILLKNAVLKKKERLLELQIALAERNLRRQL